MKFKTMWHTLSTLLVAALFIMASCEEELIGSEKANTPVNNFDHFWKTFDSHYGLFEVKGIDWNAMYSQYRPQVNDAMTDEELYAVLSDMIVRLNDNHVNLYPTNGTLPVFPGGVLRYTEDVLTIKKVQDDYDLEVVKGYLTEYHQVTENIHYGKLPGNIGYVNISGTDNLNVVEKEMGDVMHSLSATTGLLVDIRGFYGGFDPVSQFLAGNFASTRKKYMTSRKRNGPQHTDFTETTEWFVSPVGGAYIKPIVVLTSAFTQSAGETFLLAMNEFDHVQTVGDITAGSFSDNPNFEMYNGWIFSVSVGDYRASDGKSYEGIGITPDLKMVTTREELLAGKDSALEKAMEIIGQ